MQPQEYLVFFQDFFNQQYLITLEYPLYAGTLAVCVWFITTIFYSLRINSLNGRNKRNLKTFNELKEAFAELELEKQKLGADVQEMSVQKELADQSASSLQERLDELSRSITQSIHWVANHEDAGQSGLTASEGLSVEALWQKFNAANQQITEKLTDEKLNAQRLQSDFDAEMAKLSEKDQQIQALQLRLESQSQQLAKMTIALEEQKTQQDMASRQMAELESKLKSQPADQPLVTPVPVLQPVESKPEVSTSPVAIEQPVIAPPPMFDFKTVQSILSGKEPTEEFVQPITDQIEAEVSVPTVSIETVTEAVQLVANEKTDKVAAKTAKKSTEKSDSKFKLGGFFANAKQTFQKFDKKLGSDPEVVEHPIVDISPLIEEVENQAETMSPLTEETPIIVPESAQAPVEDKKGNKLGAMFGKFKRNK